MRIASFALLAALMLAVPAQAVEVEVVARGEVEWNFVRVQAPLNQVEVGDSVEMRFIVDSEVFKNSTSYPTRGYEIDATTYELTFGGDVTVQLEAPPWYPPTSKPRFTLRDNDPAVDGFFVAWENVDWPYPGLFLNTQGFCGNFEAHFDVGYTGDTLESLDIVDATGFYDFDGLGRYYFNVVDCGFEAIGILFQDMTISLVPIPVAVDVKPEGCPNPINQRSRGETPAAILGTDELDVMTLDPASIRLAGVPARHSDYEDVGTPFEPYLGKSDCDYDCNEWGGDGYMDMTVKFDTQALMDAIGETEDGQCHVVQLTGNFLEEFGGGPIIGEDVVVMVPKEKGGREDRFIAPLEEPGPLDQGTNNDTMDFGKF